LNRSREENSQVFDEIRALTVIRPDGTIVYENRSARELLGHRQSTAANIMDFLTTRSEWDTILLRLEQSKVENQPVLLQTTHGDTDLCYLTATPQRDEVGQIEDLICVWSVRNNPVDIIPASADNAELNRYVQDLEKLIEHRTYQQVLAAEQNEFLSEVIEIVPEGLLVVSPDGDVLYRNRAMNDDFGLRTAEYGQPNIRYFLSSDICGIVWRTVETGLRACTVGPDPGGLDAMVDILPLLRAGAVRQIVLHFRRVKEGIGRT